MRTKNPEGIMECLMTRWISYFGAPKKILSDGRREFQNEEMVKFSEKWGIELKYAASESSWGNGKCEKVVDLLKKTLRKLKEDGLKKEEYG